MQIPFLFPSGCHFEYYHAAVLTLLGLLNLLKAKMDGDSLQVSKPGGNHLYRNSGGRGCDAVLLHAHYYRSSHWISHQRICNSYADIPCIFHHTRQDVYPVDE